MEDTWQGVGDHKEWMKKEKQQRGIQRRRRGRSKSLSSLLFLVFASSSGRFLSSSLRSSLAPALSNSSFLPASFVLLPASSCVEVLFCFQCSSLSFILSIDYKTAAVSRVHFTQVVSPVSLSSPLILSARQRTWLLSFDSTFTCKKIRRKSWTKRWPTGKTFDSGRLSR